jgi:glutamine synthetase
VTPLTSEEMLQQVKEHDVRFVDLQFTDIVGSVKSVTIPATLLPEVLEQGVWFDGSAVEGFARVAESDMYLMPDLSTFAVLPWLSGKDTTARLICNVYTPNFQPFIGDPRGVLCRAMEAAAQMGFVYHTGPELEFFLLKPNPDGGVIPPRLQDTAGYFDIPTDLIGGLRREMTSTLEAFGITVETMHAEAANGQHEIDFRYSDALRTADNAVTFRVALKIIAQQNGLRATFLPKPIRSLPGNGMHVHQSLVYTQTGMNAFTDPGDPYGLSQIARCFAAGQLAHARGMCAILAPLVNSYKRLVSGYEAPVYISWGRINRSALIRVPRSHDPQATRLELRCPDPSCNPYLAQAVMLAAGLDGIRRELPLQEASEENLYLLDSLGTPALPVLPASLEEALEELEQDEVVREALGPHVFERFVAAKCQEWEDYRLEVTPWELEKYLSVF